MYNRVFKNYQVNVGNPLQIKEAFEFNTINLTPSYNEEEDEIYSSEPDESADLVDEARKEAEKIIQEAQHEAKRIVQEAKAESEKQRITEEEEARKKGYDYGVNEGKKQYESLIKEAEKIRENAKAEYAATMAGIEPDAVGLIIDIAKKVICSEIKTDKEYIINLLKEAIEKCTNKEKIILRVSAEDFDYVGSNKAELLSEVNGLDELELKKDLSLKEGSCIVETQYGSIDAGTQTRMSKIEEAFKRTIGRQD